MENQLIYLLSFRFFLEASFSWRVKPKWFIPRTTSSHNRSIISSKLTSSPIGSDSERKSCDCDREPLSLKCFVYPEYLGTRRKVKISSKRKILICPFKERYCWRKGMKNGIKEFIFNRKSRIIILGKFLALFLTQKERIGSFHNNPVSTMIENSSLLHSSHNHFPNINLDRFDISPEENICHLRPKDLSRSSYTKNEKRFHRLTLFFNFGRSETSEIMENKLRKYKN